MFTNRNLIKMALTLTSYYIYDKNTNTDSSAKSKAANGAKLVRQKVPSGFDCGANILIKV
ncbi:hypothetical protein J14TS2_01610 [Bacillus sp. J14TS2]|nr:hypothetical protein J14TS2_01610 [Bacillus sp. J14TS2]